MSDSWVKDSFGAVRRQFPFDRLRVNLAQCKLRLEGVVWATCNCGACRGVALAKPGVWRRTAASAKVALVTGDHLEAAALKTDSWGKRAD